MEGLRLAMVSPRYWPQVDEPARFFSRLAIAFAQRGLRPTVITARWSPQWPARVTHCGVPVVRLPAAPRGGWATLRYMRELSRWLRQHRHELDLLYVSNLKYEAYMALRAALDRPVVLRPSGSGVDGDEQWLHAAPFGRRIARRCLQRSDAVIVPDGVFLAEMRSLGVAEGRLHNIPFGARVQAQRSHTRRFEARTALAEVNRDLAVPDFAPVAVCVERLEADRGLREVVQAWYRIGRRWPAARLWLIGDGSFRESLYRTISDLDLRQQVLMPGSFDDLEDVLQAADVFLSPDVQNRSAASLVDAMAAGLPVIAVAAGGTHVMMEHGTHGTLVPQGDLSRLSLALEKLFESPMLAVEMGEAARRHAERNYALETVVEQHINLFTQLVAARQGGRG